MTTAVAILMMVGAAFSAKAEVIWTLTNIVHPRYGLPARRRHFLFVVGHLDLPTIDSSGTYSFQEPGTQMGDTNFSFEFAGQPVPPPLFPCSGLDLGCRWMISFASSVSGPSLVVDYRNPLDSDGIAAIGAGGTGWFGTIGSDDIMLGCGESLTCTVSGFLTLTAPEPSPLPILLVALSGFLVIAFTAKTIGAPAAGRAKIDAHDGKALLRGASALRTLSATRCRARSAQGPSRRSSDRCSSGALPLPYGAM